MGSGWVVQKMEMRIKAGSREGQVGVGWGWDGDPRYGPLPSPPGEGHQAPSPSDATYSLLSRFALSFGHRQSPAGIQYSRIEVSAAC